MSWLAVHKYAYCETVTLSPKTICAGLYIIDFGPIQVHSPKIRFRGFQILALALTTLPLPIFAPKLRKTKFLQHLKNGREKGLNRIKQDKFHINLLNLLEKLRLSL